MKKKMIALFLVMMLLLTPFMAATSYAMALAEGEAVKFDWTPIFVAAIGLISSVATALAGYVFVKWVKPFLERLGFNPEQLRTLAGIFVDAAEAAYGRGQGDRKLQQVLEWLGGYGFNVDTVVVKAAIKAAWKDLDLRQIAAGEKAKPPEQQEQQADEADPEAEEE